MIRRNTSSILRDIVHAVRVGAIFATVLSGIVLLIYWIDGPQRFLEKGLTPGIVIGLYFFGAITGGIVFGLLRPVTERRVSAAVVGAIAFSPMLFATCAIVWGNPAAWDPGLWAGWVIASVVLGGGYTYIWWGA